MSETNTHEDDFPRSIIKRGSETRDIPGEAIPSTKPTKIHSSRLDNPKAWLLSSYNPHTNPAPTSPESDPSNRPETELLP